MTKGRVGEERAHLSCMLPLRSLIAGAEAEAMESAACWLALRLTFSYYAFLDHLPNGGTIMVSQASHINDNPHR